MSFYSTIILRLVLLPFQSFPFMRRKKWSNSSVYKKPTPNSCDNTYSNFVIYYREVAYTYILKRMYNENIKMLLHIFKCTINHWRTEYIETLNLSTLWACPAQVFLCWTVEKLDSEVSDNYWSINNNIYFTIEWKDMYSKAVSFPFCQICLYIE